MSFGERIIRSMTLFRLATGFVVLSIPLLAGGDLNVTPEPSMLAIAGLGLAAMVLIARKTRRR